MGLLFYSDESYDNQHHFHGGLLLDADQVAEVEKIVPILVTRAIELGLTDNPRVELHGNLIFHGQKDWKPGHGNYPAIQQWFTDFLHSLAAVKVEFICRGTSMPRFNSRYANARTAQNVMFSNVLERVNERLQAIGDYALVVADETDEYGASMRWTLERGKSIGTRGYRSQKLERIVDTAYFVNSRLSPMMQVVDVCMFMRRRLERRHQDSRLQPIMNEWRETLGLLIPEPKHKFNSVS